MPRVDTIDRMTDQGMRVTALAEMKATITAFDWSRLTDGRRQILEAFLRVATTEGYSSVSMRTLGTRLNVKAPTLYSHFPGGRDELIGMALRWHYYRWTSEAIATLEPIVGAEEFFDTLINYYVHSQLTLAENEMFDLLLANDRYAATLPAAIRAEAERLVLLVRNLVAGAIHDLGHRDSDYAAGIVMTLLDSVRSWSRSSGPPDDLDARVAEARSITTAILDRVDVLGDSALGAAGRARG